MSKKEFYETYIKDNRTEDEKMMDIIHENSRKVKNDRIYEARPKRAKKGNLWLSRMVWLTDVIIIILLIALLVKIYA